MRIIIVTQDEPFYLGKHLEYLFNQLPSWLSVEGVILLKASPFGKTDSLWKMVSRTYSVFGFSFLLRYAIKFVQSKCLKRQFLIKNILKKYNILEIKLARKNINAEENLKIFKLLQLDLIISISANQIFKRDLLRLPKSGCLNLHAAILPKYKGLMPTFWALKNNESEFGVSVFIMDEGIDTGEIVVQKTINIEPEDSLESLIEKNKMIGMDAVIESINLLKIGKYKSIKFSRDEGSYYSFPTRKDVNEFKRAGKKFW